jgi:transcription elongation factor Elf1
VGRGMLRLKDGTLVKIVVLCLTLKNRRKEGGKMTLSRFFYCSSCGEQNSVICEMKDEGKIVKVKCVECKEYTLLEM